MTARGALRDGLGDAATALGSVLDPAQQPVADRLANLGAALLAPRRWWRRGGCICTARSDGAP